MSATVFRVIFTGRSSLWYNSRHFFFLCITLRVPSYCQDDMVDGIFVAYVLMIQRKCSFRFLPISSWWWVGERNENETHLGLEQKRERQDLNNNRDSRYRETTIFPNFTLILPSISIDSPPLLHPVCSSSCVSVGRIIFASSFSSTFEPRLTMRKEALALLFPFSAHDFSLLDVRSLI